VTSATAVIQQALAQAGLVAPDAQAQVSQARAAFVDLNPAPDWTSPVRTRQARPWGASVDLDEDVAVVDEAASGQFIAGVFANDGGRRRYKLIIPAQAAQDGPRAVVVLMPGGPQTTADSPRGTP